jgi:hypothetical protein
MNLRRRWLALFLISAGVSIAAIIGIVAWAGSGDPRSELRRDAADDLVHQVLPWMILIGIVGVVLAILKFAIRVLQAIETRQPAVVASPGPRGFPVVADAAVEVSSADGPGQYRIQGVHKETKLDISKYVQADSAANAMVKAELDGIVVTSVKKVPT